MKHFWNKRYNHIMLCICLCSLFLAAVPSVNAYAYTSWITSEDDVTIEIDGMETTPLLEQENNDSIQEAIGNLFFTMGDFINRLMNGDGTSYLSIDAMMMGRLVTGDYSVTTFGLEENNPYGIHAAKMFVILRNLLYTFFVVFGAWIFLGQAVSSNTSRAWQMLKEDVLRIALMFMMLYLIPQLAQAALVLKEQVIELISVSFTGSGMVAGITEHYRNSYIASENVLDAVLYFAINFASVFFMTGYVGIAMGAMILFAMSPVICILAVRDKQILSSWGRQFSANLAVPVIDYFLFLLPITVSNIAALPEGVRMIVSLVMVWSIIPTRMIAMSLLGAGRAGGNGMAFGGLLSAALFAMRALGGSRGGGRSRAGGNAEAYDTKDNDAHIQMESKNAQNFNEEFRNLQDSYKGLNEDSATMSQTGGSTSINIGEESGSSGGYVPAGMEESPAGGGTSGGSADGSGSGETFGYAQTFEDFDTFRGDNLQKIDALEESITGYEESRPYLEELKAEEMRDDMTITNAKTSIANNMVEINDLEKVNTSLQEKIDNPGNMSMDEFTSANQTLAANKERIQELQSQNSFMEKDIKTAEAAKEDRKNKGFMSQEKYEEKKDLLQQRKELEQKLGGMQELHGGTGETFKNKADYDNHMRMQQIKKETLNYKNFDLGKNGQLCTPQERADFLRERHRHNDSFLHNRGQDLKTAGKTVAKVGAGTAGAVVGASAMMFGGPSAMMAGATAGGMAATGAANAAVNTGKSAVEKVDKVVSGVKRNEVMEKTHMIKPNPVKTAVKNTAKTAANISNNVRGNLSDTSIKNKNSNQTQTQSQDTQNNTTQHSDVYAGYERRAQKQTDLQFGGRVDPNNFSSTGGGR